MALLNWDVYEISSEGAPLHGVWLRKSLRTFCVENSINAFVENCEKEHKVRFALLSGEDPSMIKQFLEENFQVTKVKKLMSKIHNPMLSKYHLGLGGSSRT